MTDTYKDKLLTIPAPGSGCHPFLMSVCNSGVMEGVHPDQMLTDIHDNIPLGERSISRKEIQDTIDKAFAEKGVIPESRKVISAPAPFRATPYRQHLVDATTDAPTAQLITSIKAMSRVDIPPEGDTQFAEWISHCFDECELLFMGDDAIPGLMGRSIKTALDWSAHTQVPHPKFIINPLDGEEKPTKMPGRTTFRGDGNVSRFRHALVEMDGVPAKEQLRMWTTIIKRELLTIKSLTYSGSKSIHALVDVSERVSCQDDWSREIRGHFFPSVMVPLGADKACQNPASLSRVPGFKRDNGKIQELFYLG